MSNTEIQFCQHFTTSRGRMLPVSQLFYNHYWVPTMWDKDKFTSWGGLQRGTEIVTIPCDTYCNRKYSRHYNIPENKWMTLNDSCQEDTTAQFIYSGRGFIGMNLVVKSINWIGMSIYVRDCVPTQFRKEKKKMPAIITPMNQWLTQSVGGLYS